MKRFSFALERVLALRRRQLEESEARLNEIREQKQLARQKAEFLEGEFRQLGESVSHRKVATGAELRATHGYLRALDEGRRAEYGAEQKCERRRREQVKELLEIRRKVKLLERLRERKLGAYLKTVDQDLENQTAESFLASWARGRRR